MDLLQAYSIGSGINFRCINSSKFKTSRISASFFLPINKDSMSINALLVFMLKHSCKKFPSFLELNKKLTSLFGASLDAGVTKIGDNQVLSLSISGINDRFAFDDTVVSKELSRLLCEIICNPDLLGSNFKEEIVKQEKRQLLELMESEFNDKRIYARNRLQELMCKDEPFGINKYGNIEDVEEIRTDNLYAAWENLLKTAKIEILMIGENGDQKDALNEFKEAFSKIKREYPGIYKTDIIRTSKTVRNYEDSIDVTQSKLVLGFRTDVSRPDDDVINTRVMTALFGGTPNSKLFVNVREKLSLCYYCSASFDQNKGIMIVESGVQGENIEKAKAQILKELDDIKCGNFTDNELNAVKLSLANSFTTAADYMDTLEYYYTAQLLFDDIVSLDDMVRRVLKVTRENIIEAAKKVSLDTVYTLKNK